MSSTQWIVLGIGLGVLVLGIIFIVVGFLTRRKLNVMADTQTVGAGEAAQVANPSGTARVEVYGNAESDQPLTAPISGKPCVYYRLRVEELRVRYDRDSQGNTHRRESWDTVTDEKRFTPFYIRDSSGAILVEPEKADFVARQTVNNAFGAPGYEQGSRGGIGGVVGDVVGAALGAETSRGMRSSEWIVPTGEPTYVIGSALATGAGSVLAKGEGHFIISYKSEEELARKYNRAFILWSVFGGIFAVGGIVLAIVGGAVIK